MPQPLEAVSVRGEKVVLREKRVEDASRDYSWRVDTELAKLDATRPLNMSYSSFLEYSKEELRYPNPCPGGSPSTPWTGSTSATACTTTSI